MGKDIMSVSKLKHGSGPRAVNMTTGDPTRLMLSFMIPMLIGNVFQQFYNLADTMVVGQFVSADALAAVGSTGSLTNLFFALCNGLASGAGIIVSQYFGAGNTTWVRRTIVNAFFILFTTGVVMGGAGAMLARPVLAVMKTPSEILDQAVLYMRITCVGVLGTAMYNAVAAILLGVGDSKTPLVFLIFSSIMNIVMDLVFVIWFHWGVAGVAGATVAAQMLSAAASITYARLRNPLFCLRKEDWMIDRGVVRECFRLGVPMAIQSGMMSASGIVLQRVVNSFGAKVMAAWTTVHKIENLINQPLGTLSRSLSTFTGQNIGAGKADRVRLGIRKGLIMAMTFVGMMMVIMWVFSGSLMRLFVNDGETEVIFIGAKALRILALFYFFLGAIYVYRGTLNGAGDARFSLMTGIAEMVGRIAFPGTISAIPSIGYWGLWIGNGLTWILVAATGFLRYHYGPLQKKIAECAEVGDANNEDTSMEC